MESKRNATDKDSLLKSVPLCQLIAIFSATVCVPISMAVVMTVLQPLLSSML